MSALYTFRDTRITYRTESVRFIFVFFWGGGFMNSATKSSEASEIHPEPLPNMSILARPRGLGFRQGLGFRV